MARFVPYLAYISSVASLDRYGGTPNSPVVRDHSASVAVDQSPHEALVSCIHMAFLPRLEPDRSFMLAPGAVLREEAGPVLRIHRHIHAPGLALIPACLLAGHDRLHRLRAFFDDSRIPAIRSDLQSP